MKKLKLIMAVVILVLFCVNIAPAGDRTFFWDQNTEADLKMYTLYRSAAPDVQAEAGNLWLKIWKPGENPDTADLVNVEYIVNGDGNCTLPYNIIPDGVYYFVMTASDTAGNESGRSNEVSTIIDDTAPAPPGGLQCAPAQ